MSRQAGGCGGWARGALIGLACSIGALFAQGAFAHAGERAFVLLLPTGLYILGGAIASQLPMTALMVAYTIFGLWLLATPVAA